MRAELDLWPAEDARPDPAEIIGPEAGISESLATLAHEMKTPLASLLGYSRMLRVGWAGLGEAQREEFFDVLEQQGRRLHRMIEDLLETARIDAGIPSLRREPLDLVALVGRAVATVAGMAERRRISIEAPSDNLGVYGDASAIEHVLTNLLENAIKYTQDGTSIAVVVSEHDTEVHVAVTDEGSGVDPDDIPHVFDRFRRGNGVVSGVGLGLHIVRSLIAAHKGRVWVESQPGEGATFTFALPRRSR